MKWKIENEKQYQRNLHWIGKFEESLREAKENLAKQSFVPDTIRKAQIAGLEGTLIELREQVEEWEKRG